MPKPSDDAVTQLLAEMASGDQSVAKELLPLLYDELREMADHVLRAERPGHTLQPTALVHEAFVKLSGRDDIRATNRTQFLVLASKVMRYLLVDHARTKKAAKKGGGWDRITLSGLKRDTPADRLDVLALEEALEKLATLNERDARMVELRFYGGLTSEEAAEALGISRTEVARRWRITRAWLAAQLEGSNDA